MLVLGKRACRLIRSMSSGTGYAPTSEQHTKHVQINQQLVQCRTGKQVEELVLGSKMGDFNAVNCSTALQQLAKLNTGRHHRISPATLDKVYSMASKQYFMPRSIATVCHAIASGELDQQIPSFVLKQIALGNNEDEEFPFKTYTPQGLSMIMWSFAKLGQEDEFVFSRCTREIFLHRNLQTFDAQHLSNIVWALAKVKYNSDGVFRKVSLELQRREWQGCLPQHLSTIALAYAKMKQIRHVPMLYYSMSRTCLMQRNNDEFANEFKFQTLALICFSFASMQHKDDELFLRISRALLRKSDGEWLREFSNQGVANVLWSFAKMALVDDELFARSGDLLLKRGDFSNPITVTSVLWSFAKLGMDHPVLFERIAQAVQQQSFLEQVKPQGLSNLMWAFAKTKYRNEGLVERVAGELVNARQVERFVTEDLVQLVWAFVKLGQHHKPVVNKLISELVRRPLQEFTNKELADMTWALETIANPNNDKALEQCLNEAKIRKAAAAPAAPKAL
ncbi:hypothetical protein BASA81_007768 [Batrachochytrium salamandrivorans]|nr:hypothetical protein BASA81_007768 [Batrachochytrium salamandrivorans]